MSEQPKPLVFSVTRNDLLFNYASRFEDVFRFSPSSDEPASQDQGVRMQESLGFDFQSECDPFIEIAPPAEAIRNALDEEAKNFCITVLLEDIALGVRVVVFSIGAEEISDLAKHPIDLNSFASLGFARGFSIRCFVSRKTNLDPKANLIWNKSQIVFEANFIVKASAEEALFEIAWTTFRDPDDRKNVMYYVDWTSSEVSSSPHTDCFQVKANNDLKAQYKRLENNSHFGELCIRIMADHILSDLAENALRCAELGSEPLEGSLHDKMRAFFDEVSLDFEVMAANYQQGDKIDQLRAVSEVSKKIQSTCRIAATLNGVKFGGYRRT